MLAKIKAFALIVGHQIADIWNRSKILLLAVGALIITLEFRKLKDMFLIYLANKQINTAKKEDASLATQESNDNAQADALVKQAGELPATEIPVTSDWYKKDQT